MAALSAVLGVVDEVRERAVETETANSVPADLARKIGATGAFHLYVPAALGGQAADPITACETVEALSYADGSTGWTSMILNTTFFTSWLDPAVADEMLDTDRQLGMAGLFGPIGRTEPVDGDGDSAGTGAVRLSGRYPFNSGSPHATWFCEGAFVLRDDGTPDWRFLFVPAAEVEILDTWHVAGLRGTASHDVVVDGAVVPRERMASPIFERAPHDEAHFRWSFFALLGSLMSGFPLGVARRSLDEFVALAAHKTRGRGPLATEQVTQLSVARGEGTLRAARCLVTDALGDAWDTACAGDEITLEQRVAIRLAASNAMRAGIEVVDEMFRLAGGGALYEASPLQRCWRDLHAGNCHLYFSDNHVAGPAQVLLGQPAETFLL